MATATAPPIEAPEAPPAKKSRAKKEPERKALIQINTLAPERPFAEIDNVRHDFRLMQDFGAREHQEFMRESRRYDELFSSEEELSDADSIEMETLLDGLFRRVLVSPDGLGEQLGENLSGAIKRSLFLTFTNAPLLMQMAQEMKDQEAENHSTTAS